MNKIKIAVIAAFGMISLAVCSYGQVPITAVDGDMLMGFRLSGNVNDLEVDLGNFSQFTQMNGSDFFLPQLSVLDLQADYGTGTTWQQSGLLWSIATSSFNTTPNLALNSIFETSVNNGSPSVIYQRQAGSLQRLVCGHIDQMTQGLNGATSTVNSNFAANIPDSGNSYNTDINAGPNPWNANSISLFSFSAVENNTAIGSSGFVSSDLYELLPTTTGHANAVLLGTFELFSNGTLEYFSVIPEPSTYRMLALGGALLCGLMILRRRRFARN
jgi:hypothetical protein